MLVKYSIAICLLMKKRAENNFKNNKFYKKLYDLINT